MQIENIQRQVEATKADTGSKVTTEQLDRRLEAMDEKISQSQLAASQSNSREGDLTSLSTKVANLEAELRSEMAQSEKATDIKIRTAAEQAVSAPIANLQLQLDQLDAKYSSSGEMGNKVRLHPCLAGVV